MTTDWSLICVMRVYCGWVTPGTPISLIKKEQQMGKLWLKPNILTGWRHVQQRLSGLCTCYLISIDIITEKNTLSGVIPVLTFLRLNTCGIDKITSLGLDTQQATQVFDCTSQHTLSLSEIRKRGDETAEGSKEGWSSFPGRNLWHAVWRPASARNSSW